MLTRIGFAALVVLFALSITPPSIAETSSAGGLFIPERAQNVTMQFDSSLNALFPDYYGGTCTAYYEDERCDAFAWDQSECCGMTIQCPSGNYTWGQFWYPYYGWPMVCEGPGK